MLASAIIGRMLLVTGGTGFIGSRFTEKLLRSRQDIRLLLRPQKSTPSLPQGIALDIAVSGLDDERGLRAAMKDVDTIFHFASAENQAGDADLEGVDVKGTENLIFSAKAANVKKIFFLSRIGVDKSSTYPVIRAKAFAEDLIRRSGIPFCILRLTDVYGENDHFTVDIANALRNAPGIMPIPAGNTIIQPLWIEDLVSSMILILEEWNFKDRVYEIGGGEFLPLTQILEIIGEEVGRRKWLVPVAPAYLRIFNLWIKQFKGVFPLPTRWLDLLAMDRTCPLDSLPRTFGILPARFSKHIDYLTRA